MSEERNRIKLVSKHRFIIGWMDLWIVTYHSVNRIILNPFYSIIKFKVEPFFFLVFRHKSIF